MATTIFRFQADPGQTLEVFFTSVGGTGTPDAGGYSCTEGGGWYYCNTIVEPLVGMFIWSAVPTAGGLAVANGLVVLADDTNDYYGYDPPNSSGIISSGGATAAEVWDYLLTAISTAGSVGKLLKDNLPVGVAAALDTQGLTSVRAAKLDNLDGTITSRQSEANASSRHTTLVAEHDATQAAIAAIDVTADVQSGLTAQGYTTPRAENLDDLDATISSRQSEADAVSRASTNATAHSTTQSAIAALPSASTIASTTWSVLTTSATTADSMGKLVVDNLDTTISSREAETSASTRAGTNQAEHDATQAAISGITAEVSPADIAAIADAVWQYLTTSATMVNSLGKLLVDNVNATISSREAESDAATRASMSQTEHDATQAAITALNNISVSDVTGAFTTMGYTALRAANLDNLDAAVSSRESELSASSRATTNQTEHDTTQVAIAAIDVDAEVTSALVALGYTSTRAGYIDNIATAAPTAEAIADAVLDEVLSGHQTAGTAGEAIKIARDQAVVAANNTQV